MEVIDDEGNLFGVVNVVDALVVLLVLAVIVAGSAFVLGSKEEEPEPEPETRYATLDLGTQPAYVAELIEKGNSVNYSDGDTLTITDVYVTDHADGNRVLLRAELKSPPTDGQRFDFNGDPPRVGRELSISTNEYSTSGQIRSVSESDPTLDLVNRNVLLRTEVSADEAAALSVGDEYRVNGQTVGTVQSVDAYGTGNPDRRLVYVGVTYVTYELRAQPQFAGEVVREGAKLPFRTDAYEFEGHVVRKDVLEQRGEQTTRTVTLEIEDAQPDVANSLDAGMREQIDGETIAALSNVTVEPAQIVLTSDDGNVYLREHPVKKDVTITAELQVRESVTGVKFKGESIRPGDTVLIDLGTVTIRATVTSL